MSTPPTPRRQRLPFAPAHHCWSCGDPINAFQAAGQGGVCPRFECRAAESRRRQAEDRQLEAQRHELARTRMVDEGVDPDTASWSVTPHNDAEPVPLTPERRKAFLDYLRRTTREAAEEDGPNAARPGKPPAATEADRAPPPDGFKVELGASGSDGPPGGQPVRGGRFEAPEPAEARALAAGCATCRGWCCRQGGTHAFLTADRIRRLLRERPDLDPDDVPALYEGYLGPRHLRGGCVFQGESGCRLPRELRGDTCNEYFCPDLVQVRRQWRKPGSGDDQHRFVAVRPGGKGADSLGTVPMPDDV